MASEPFCPTHKTIKNCKKYIAYHEQVFNFEQFGSNATIRIVKTVNLTNFTKSDKIGSIRCEFCHLAKKVTTIVSVFTKSEALTEKYYRK